MLGPAPVTAVRMISSKWGMTALLVAIPLQLCRLPSLQNIARNATLASRTSISQGQSFKDDDEIIKQARQESLDGTDNNSGDSDSDSDDNIEPETRDNIVALCRQMEHVGMTSTDPLGAELANLAHKFCGLVVKQSIRESKQTTLDGWTTKATTTTKGKERGGSSVMDVTLGSVLYRMLTTYNLHNL
jgi:hypothetical protein